MSEERRIYANYDDEGVYVYQAFKPTIVKSALENGTFGRGFNMERMTWIKPSFAWMLYRSGYATKKRQEAILKIKVSHEGFLTILGESVETSYTPRIYKDIDDWRITLKKSAVRHQWDPERYLTLAKHPQRRAIQIGIRAWVVQKYVNDWIISLEDVTHLAKAIKTAKATNCDFPPVPDERVYTVDDNLVRRLGITG
ncbi:MAG: DUF4291 domain-containing protein [Phototrophicaceae bacterium]